MHIKTITVTKPAEAQNISIILDMVQQFLNIVSAAQTIFSSITNKI